jgi:hypothetical protein
VLVSVRPTERPLSRPGATGCERQSGTTAAARRTQTHTASCSRRDAVQVPLNEGLQPRANVRRPVGCSGKLARTVPRAGRRNSTAKLDANASARGK